MDLFLAHVCVCVCVSCYVMKRLDEVFLPLLFVWSCELSHQMQIIQDAVQQPVVDETQLQLAQSIRCSSSTEHQKLYNGADVHVF